MRILIIGGGIAGLTLGALLRQRGIEPTIIERSSSYRQVGYVLGLWPLASRVLIGLKLDKRFNDSSIPMTTYEIRNGKGDILHTYELTGITEKYGQMRSIMRSELLDVLRAAIPADGIKMNTTVQEIEENENEVNISFSDGSKGTFDLVVGCDGIKSQTRKLIFGEMPLNYTGWSGWAWWLDPNISRHEQVTEYWGAGRFFGIYPAKEKLCCFIGMPRKQGEPDLVENRVNKIKMEFGKLGGSIPEILSALKDPDEIYFTEFSDIKLDVWNKGRVLLIGDAGQGILPTAGIGASMAMESAAVLADELTRVNAKTIPIAIQYFSQRRHKRVDHIQAECRKLAKIMFVESTPLAVTRNEFLKFYTTEQLFKSFTKTLDEAI